ncbi:hypothetical protein FACS1894170_02850 [Planctomycetales bacterium]|nr:hypothetical protein FACS1894170_02850 [Planctomycetales bacterium]
MPARKEPDAATYAGRFAIRLRQLREKAKLTPQEVADAVGVIIGTIYHWESGHSFPKPNQLPILAETLKITDVRTLFPKK